MSKPTVAIIGAGPAGLVAAKEALANGLHPVVFEKHSELGGLWHPHTGATWPGMRTNISKFTSVFPDFPWPDAAPEFPTQQEMYEYLCAYAKKFDLEKHIRFETKVSNISKVSNQWSVDSGRVELETFDYVIIASGIFSEPAIPNKIFFERAIHSSQYKKDLNIINTNDHVLIRGGAYSGVEIAAEVSTYAKSVTHIISYPQWIIKRKIGDKPIDRVFYDQPNRKDPHEVLLKTPEENIKANAYMATLSPTQADPKSPLYINPNNNSNPVKASVSDTYIEQVNNGKIKVWSNANYKADTKLNKPLAYSVVIFCTGYKLNLDFLDPQLRETLSFKPDDQLQPILLHKCTFHPELPGMAFVGMYRGPYLPIMELQAKWATQVFSGKSALPDKSVMQDSIRLEQKIRDLPREQRPQFPHADYPGLKNDLKNNLMLYTYKPKSKCPAKAAAKFAVVAELGLSAAFLVKKHAYKL